MRTAAALVILLVATSSATAAPADVAVTAAGSATSDDAPAVGFRIGGYGFRREGDARPVTGWEECRMNGAGVFLDHRLRGPLFVEGGLDAYFTQDFILASPASDLPVDRMSGLLTGAIGARARLTRWLTGSVQLGAGVELTRVSVPYGDDGTTIRANKALPMGFFGFGGELRVARATYLGATVRMMLMGNFDYDPKRLQMGDAWVAQPAAGQVFAATADLALQTQFYVRRAL